MSQACGNFIIAAGLIGAYPVIGLPISPERVYLKGATLMSGCSLVEGLATKDVPAIAPSPYNQGGIGWNIVAGVLQKYGNLDFPIYIVEFAAPNRVMIAYISEIAGNGFVLTVNTNTLTGATLVQWVASA